MDWQTQSPDSNPIKNLWKMIGEKTFPNNSEELWDNLFLDAQNDVTTAFCKKNLSTRVEGAVLP